jgi:hypothetical protein
MFLGVRGANVVVNHKSCTVLKDTEGFMLKMHVLIGL